MDSLENAVQTFGIPGALTHLYNHARSNKQGWQQTFIFFVIEQNMVRHKLMLLDDYDNLQSYVSHIMQAERHKGYGTIITVLVGSQKREALMMTVFDKERCLASALAWKDEEFRNVEVEVGTV